MYLKLTTTSLQVLRWNYVEVCYIHSVYLVHAFLSNHAVLRLCVCKMFVTSCSVHPAPEKENSTCLSVVFVCS